MLTVDFGVLKHFDSAYSTERMFDSYQEASHKAVSRLVNSRQQPGAWTDWLNLAHQPELISLVNETAQKVRHQFTDMVVLGIGGSSLGGYALLRALKHPYWNQLPDTERGGWLRYHFLENVDADQINAIKDVLDLRKTLFLVITKSGSTAETMSAFLHFQQLLEAELGATQWKKHIIAITDPNSGLLRQLADDWQLSSLPVPADVGGRFSVFSAVGLLPAALCGINIDQLINGVRQIEPQLLNPNLKENPAAQAAVVQTALNEAGKRLSVFMPYSARLASVADWYVQLWAESLGKEVNDDGTIVNSGQTPVKAVGVTDQHSQVQLFNEGPNDKVITFVQVLETDNTLTIPNNTLKGLEYLGGKTFQQLMTAEFEATRASLTQNSRPNWTIQIPRVDTEHVAQLLFFLEVQTALTGFLMGIDPFNQPGVELGKQFTYALMGREGYSHLLEQLKQPAVAR